MVHNDTIKLLIAYDEQLVADGLKCILSGQNNFKVIGQVKNDDDIFHTITKLNPDIIVFEFTFWKSEYRKLMAEIHSRFQQLGILIISEKVSHDILRDVMPVIKGYIVRSCSSEKLILAINEINGTGKYMCPTLLEEYFGCGRTVKTGDILTIREKEILCRWIESDGYEEIADFLNISISTVRTHINNIRQKLGNLNNLQLMIYACRQNILNQNFKPICPNCRSFCN